jgi:hypothetical protein
VQNIAAGFSLRLVNLKGLKITGSFKNLISLPFFEMNLARGSRKNAIFLCPGGKHA